MNLTLFFRLALMSIFQPSITSLKKGIMGTPMNYDTEFFYLPRVYAKDGWHISLQINRGNYCSSENGYRCFGHTMQAVEFGFPSAHEELLVKHAEDDGDITKTVGSVPVSVLESIFEKRGGIDWEKTLSIEAFNLSTKS